MKKTCLTALALAFYGAACAQQISPHVVNSSGSTLSTGSAMLTFSVGETAITRVGSSGNHITQGFLQPDVNGTSVRENNSSYSFEAYPNPVSSELNIHSENFKDPVQVKLIDGMGRIMYSGELKNNPLSLDYLTNGIYQLILLDKEQKVITQKTIIKTN